RRPFAIPAIVLLPDHLHTIWTLPEGDQAYPVCWKRIKEEFTELYLAAGGTEGSHSLSRLNRQERGIWQRRYLQHVIWDDTDLHSHFDYIHYNPVKHRLVPCRRDWPWSTFDRWVEKGNYPADWGCVINGPMVFDGLDEKAME